MISIVLTASAFSCKQEGIVAGFQDITDVVKNSEQYSKALNARANATKTFGEKFEILDVKKEGAILKIDFQGGCDLSNYKLIWDGKVMESYPEQVNLILVCQVPNDNQEECQAMVRHTLKADLTELVNFKADNVIVNLYSGSTTQHIVMDENGVVTNKPE